MCDDYGDAEYLSRVFFFFRVYPNAKFLSTYIETCERRNLAGRLLGQKSSWGQIVKSPSCLSIPGSLFDPAESTPKKPVAREIAALVAHVDSLMGLVEQA